MSAFFAQMYPVPAGVVRVAVGDDRIGAVSSLVADVRLCATRGDAVPVSLLFRDMQPILAAHCETVRDLCILFVEVVAALSCGW